MLRKRFLILLLLCLLNSCAHAPTQVVTACVIDAKAGGCQCYDQRTKKASFLTWEACDKYPAFPPEDLKSLLDWAVQ